MNREQEIEKLKSEIDKAVRDNKRGHALSLSGRLRGLAMRQKESISVPLGDFEASLKVVNAS